jgi:hypothetical protein
LDLVDQWRLESLEALYYLLRLDFLEHLADLSHLDFPEVLYYLLLRDFLVGLVVL